MESLSKCVGTARHPSMLYFQSGQPLSSRAILQDLLHRLGYDSSQYNTRVLWIVAVMATYDYSGCPLMGTSVTHGGHNLRLMCHCGHSINNAMFLKHFKSWAEMRTIVFKTIFIRP